MPASSPPPLTAIAPPVCNIFSSSNYLPVYVIPPSPDFPARPVSSPVMLYEAVMAPGAPLELETKVCLYLVHALLGTGALPAPSCINELSSLLVFKGWIVGVKLRSATSVQYVVRSEEREASVKTVLLWLRNFCDAGSDPDLAALVAQRFSDEAYTDAELATSPEDTALESPIAYAAPSLPVNIFPNTLPRAESLAKARRAYRRTKPRAYTGDAVPLYPIGTPPIVAGDAGPVLVGPGMPPAPVRDGRVSEKRHVVAADPSVPAAANGNYGSQPFARSFAMTAERRSVERRSAGMPPPAALPYRIWEAYGRPAVQSISRSADWEVPSERDLAIPRLSGRAKGMPYSGARAWVTEESVGEGSSRNPGPSVLARVR